MDWAERVRAVLRLDEEELALWPEIASYEPSEHVKAIIRMLIENERATMEEMRALVRNYGRYAPPYRDDPLMYEKK
ncbi:MAG: hypothetical protein H5U03_08925 [Clostridia bacterium]|nr:hypothetical protein [Clostridia bacterium]